MKQQKPVIVFLTPGRVYTKGYVDSLLKTSLFFVKNKISFSYFSVGYADIYVGRNSLVSNEVTAFRPGEIPTVCPKREDYTHIMWIDSDMTWEPMDIITLASVEKDIIGGLCPVHFDGRSNAMWDHPEGVVQYNMRRTAPAKGLFRVDYTGLAFLLVRRGVFESLDYPWFTSRVESYKHGGYGIAGEDTTWCSRVAEKGYKIYIDPRVRPGHEKQLEIKL
jgi:hypothetical protein